MIVLRLWSPVPWQISLRTSTRTEIVVITKITLRFHTFVSNPELFRLFASPTRQTFVICRSLIYNYWRSVPVNCIVRRDISPFLEHNEETEFSVVHRDRMTCLIWDALGDWVNLDYIFVLYYKIWFRLAIILHVTAHYHIRKMELCFNICVTITVAIQQQRFITGVTHRRSLGL